MFYGLQNTYFIITYGFIGVSWNLIWPKTENRNFGTETKTISAETETEFSAENGKIGVKMGFSDFFLWFSMNE